MQANAAVKLPPQGAFYDLPVVPYSIEIMPANPARLGEPPLAIVAALVNRAEHARNVMQQEAGGLTVPKGGDLFEPATHLLSAYKALKALSNQPDRPGWYEGASKANVERKLRAATISLTAADEELDLVRRADQYNLWSSSSAYDRRHFPAELAVRVSRAANAHVLAQSMLTRQLRRGAFIDPDLADLCQMQLHDVRRAWEAHLSPVEIDDFGKIHKYEQAQGVLHAMLQCRTSGSALEWPLPGIG